MGVPDMAVGPLYYSLYDAASVRIDAEFPEDAGKNLKKTNQTPLSPREVEEMLDVLMTADQDTVFDLITAHLKSGKSIKSLGDTIQIGAAELILRTTVPRQFTNGQHPFDYCNVANNWLRTTDNPYQARVLYLMANFINDVAHENKLPYADHRRGDRGVRFLRQVRRRRCSRELDEAIMALDAPRATAVADAYLQSGRRPPAPIWKRSRCAACRFQDDPHNQKITISTFEEYGQQLDASARPAAARDAARFGRLGQDAGRARLLCPLREGVDLQLIRSARSWFRPCQ